MVMEKMVVKRGLWNQETVSVSGPVDISELAKEVGWDKSLEDRFREHINHSVTIATRVLEKAGYPTRSGLYVKELNGEFSWLGDFGSKVSYQIGKSYHSWPYFLPVEPLSSEYFAVRLIHNARGFLHRVENGAEKWDLASMSLYYADALLKFFVEDSGLAKKASAAIETEKGAKSGRDKRSNASNYSRQVIQTEFAKLPSGSPEKKNAMRGAEAISAEVNRCLRANGQRDLGIKTIQRCIQKLNSANR
jgi:hypothetical protein